MEKSMKKRLFGLSITVFLLCVLFLLSSCQLSQILGKDETTAETTAAQTTQAETEAPVTEEYPEFDFSKITDYSSIVTLGKFKGREVSYSELNVTEEEYSTYISDVLIKNEFYNELTTGLTKENDTVNISYKGYIDNALFQGGSADNQSLTLNDTSGYIDGFAQGLIGKEVGTTVKLNLKFPSDYHSTEYAGKDVVFDVTINSVYQAKELTDEIVVQIMKDYKDCTTVEKFHEFFRAAIAEEKRSVAISGIWNEFMTESVIKDETIYTQQSAYYYNLMYNYYKQAAVYYNMSLDNILSYYNIAGEAGLKESADDYAKFDIVFNAVIKTENIGIDDNEYNTLLAEYASEINKTVEELSSSYSKEDLKSFLLERKMYNIMFDNCVITGAPQ